MVASSLTATPRSTVRLTQSSKMATKGERREEKRRKKRHGMKVDGVGNRLLASIVQRNAEEAARAKRLRQ